MDRSKEGYYGLRMRIVSRAEGHSAVKSAAYCARERIVDERTGQVHDWSHMPDLVRSFIMAPVGAPEWMHDRGQLWNRVEQQERRKDAQLARTVRISFERRLPMETSVELLKAFVQQEFVSKGMVADISIHNPNASDANAQPHAHVQLTMREIDGKGFAAKKARHWNAVNFYVEKGQKIADGVRAKSPVDGAAEALRQRWEERVNQAFAAQKSPIRVHHKSYKRRWAEAIAQGDVAKLLGIPKTPEQYLGIARHVKEATGHLTERMSNWKRSQFRRRVEGHMRSILHHDPQEVAMQARRYVDLMAVRLEPGHSMSRGPANDR